MNKVKQKFMLVLFSAFLLSSDQLWAVTKEYDVRIKAASNRYLPKWQWQWLKAQCYQESLLDPNAISSVGAKGLCQFMPATCNEIFKKLGFKCDPFNASKSITAAAFYMRSQRRIWRARRSESDRRKWAQCSYNYGAGNCIKAQKRCGNNLNYDKVVNCLPLETKTYVARIAKYYKQFSARNHYVHH